MYNNYGCEYLHNIANGINKYHNKWRSETINYKNQENSL